MLTAADVQAVMESPAGAPVDAQAADEDELPTNEVAAKLVHVSRTQANALLDSGRLGEVSRTAVGRRRVSRAASKVRQAEGPDSMAGQGEPARGLV